jgi:nucleoside-diphosphate-sugar epimerase
VVSGVTGFVGAALASRLIQDGCEVYGLVRPASNRRRIAHLARLRLIEWDGDSCDWLRTRWQACRPEVVFHLAAYGVQPGASDLIQTLRGNIDYTVSLLRATADISGCRFVHTGSCFEYGLTEPGCLLAEDAPTQPFSPYGAAKLASIHLVRTLARRWNVPAMVLRLFTIYGPGESRERLVPSLIRALSTGQPIDLTPGEQARDWLNVEDAVEAYLRAAECMDQTADVPVYNVCSAVAVTVRQLGETLARTLGVSTALLRWGRLPYRPEEPMWIVGDNRRFCAATDWSPRISIGQGLANYAAALGGSVSQERTSAA